MTDPHSHAAQAARTRWTAACVVSGIAMVAFHLAGLIGLNSSSFTVFNFFSIAGSTAFFFHAWSERAKAVRALGGGQVAVGWPLSMLAITPIVFAVLLVVLDRPLPQTTQILREQAAAACDDSTGRKQTNSGPATTGIFMFDDQVVAVRGAPSNPRLTDPPRFGADRSERAAYSELVLTEDEDIAADLVLCFTSAIEFNRQCRDHVVELRHVETGRIIARSGIEAWRDCGSRPETDFEIEEPQNLTTELRSMLDQLYPSLDLD